MTNTLSMPRHEIVAGEVRAALGRAGYRQIDIARQFNISAPSAGDLYWGRVPWSLDRLDELAEWLGVEFSELVSGGGRPRVVGYRPAAALKIRADRTRKRYTAGDLNPEPADLGPIPFSAPYRGVRRSRKARILPPDWTTRTSDAYAKRELSSTAA